MVDISSRKGPVRMTSPLFRPFTLKGLTLPNRIVMAPMTRSFLAGRHPG